MKLCPRCQTKKANECFYKIKSTKSGLSCWCKLCHNEASRKWNSLHPESIYNSNIRWRKGNPDKYKKALSDWAKRNLPKLREKERNRRAMIAGNGGKITRKDEKELFKFYNYTCLRCKRAEPEIKLTLDHVIPISIGGKNVIENAQPLCEYCNKSKGANFADYRPSDHSER